MVNKVIPQTLTSEKKGEKVLPFPLFLDKGLQNHANGKSHTQENCKCDCMINPQIRQLNANFCLDSAQKASRTAIISTEFRIILAWHIELISTLGGATAYNSKEQKTNKSYLVMKRIRYCFGVDGIRKSR